MQEAARYIDRLQSNLVCHIRTHGYPDRLKSHAGGSGSGNSGSSRYQDYEGIKRTLNSYATSQTRK